MEFAKKSEHKEFIIGTENSIVEHLQFECPDKKFYPVAVQLTCMNMKVTTLMDIYNCLKGQGGKKSSFRKISWKAPEDAFTEWWSWAVE